MAKKKKISITIDEGFYKIIAERAKKDGRSVSNLINRAIHKYLESRANNM